MIKELLNKKDIASIFALLNEPSYYLAVYEGLMAYANLTEQWLIIKAFGLKSNLNFVFSINNKCNWSN